MTFTIPTWVMWVISDIVFYALGAATVVGWGWWHYERTEKGDNAKPD